MATAGDPNPRGKEPWVRVIVGFERVVVLVLIFMLMVVVAISTLELGWMLFQDLTSAHRLLLDVEEMFDLFGFFLLVLIGMELVTSLKSYIRDGVVHVEVVLEVALIAIAQKVIIMDSSRASALSVFGQAALVIALAVAHWLVRSSARFRT